MSGDLQLLKHFTWSHGSGLESIEKVALNYGMRFSHRKLFSENFIFKFSKFAVETDIQHGYVMFCYAFLSRIASSVLKVNCYQWGSCVGGPSAFNSPFGHRSHSRSPLNNHLSDLSISRSSLVPSWVYRLPFFKSLVWLGCDWYMCITYPWCCLEKN